VWRRCCGKEIAFKWGGDNTRDDNTHEAREEGAEKLCSLLLDMRQSDPEARIHLIAHSHGGNVVLRAIELYFDRLEKQSRDILYRAREKVAGDKAPIVAIDEALREVCGDGLAKSQDFHQLAAGHLPLLLEKDFREPERRRGQFGEKFHAAWSRSPQSHRLGRLVFMGTPFYYKRWLPRSGLVRRARSFTRKLVSGVGVWLVFNAYKSQRQSVPLNGYGAL